MDVFQERGGPIGVIQDIEPTVLVVEDDVLIRLVIGEHLRDCGYRVIEAESGDEAMEMLARTDLPIDLVFSDVQMPGEVDGFDLARWVRRERPMMRVILTSGVAKLCDAAEYLETDGPLMEKPYGAADVERRIRKILRH